MEILIQATQLILSLSILVVLHELGHFIPAKLFKTKVEKFYLFFDPWFSIFKRKKGETEYGIGWLPLGGYVKIAGMIDESMDKEQMKQPPQPWEFRSKPAWQRLIIMIGGVTVNVILGMIIYAMVLFTWGESYIPNDGLTHGIYADSTANNLGFKSGDKVVSIDGENLERFSDIQKEVLLGENRKIDVIRNSSPYTFTINKNKIEQLTSKQESFLYPALIPIVDTVVDGSPAHDAGLKKGDKVISINGQNTPFYRDASQIIRKHKSEKVQLVVLRNGEELTLSPEVNEEGKIGFAVLSSEQLTFRTKEYGFFESIPAGMKKTYTSLVDYIRQIKLVADIETGAYKSLGGFLTIGKAFAPEWDWHRFWNFTAFLSIILAIMNMLPIPALDGGHVMFLTYEMITGRKPHDKVMEYAQIAGIVILLALMLLANGNDILRLFE